MKKTSGKLCSWIWEEQIWGLLKELASMELWGSAAEDIWVHKCWSLSKSHLLRAQEQATPKEGKSSKQCKGLSWLKWDLREFRQKETVQTLEARTGNTGVLERSCLALQGEDSCSQNLIRVQASQHSEGHRRLSKIYQQQTDNQREHWSVDWQGQSPHK